MFIGHHAVGFASKRFAPRSSLAVLMAAPLVLDLLWPVFLLTNVEHVRVDAAKPPFLRLDLYDYPWSHSLVMSVAWSALFGGGYWAVTRYLRGAVVCAIGVFSHWVFDFVTHSPDMPIYPGGQKIGLGLWNSTVGTILVEGALFSVGLGLYLRSTRPRDRVGTWALWGFVLVLLLAYLGSLATPPPNDPQALGWGGLGSGLFLLWVYWFDRHRTTQIT